MAYNIKLDMFEGPLDLLLHLIKEEELDIYDIPIARITEQFFEYIEVMKSLNLDVAGEYLLMASTLTYIKSKTLLPVEESEEEPEEEGIDPRDELVQKLIEYKKFKEVALGLRERELDQSQVFTRKTSDNESPDSGELLLEVSVFELLKSFKKVLDRMEGDSKITVTLEEISVTDKLNNIIERLEADESVTFDSLFDTDRNKMEVIASFLAILELLRLRIARAHQSKTNRSGEIIIYRTSEEADDNEEESDLGEKEDPATGASSESGV